jgi:hypothetical protein
MEDSTISLQNVKAYANSSAALEQERSALLMSAATQLGYEGQMDRTIQDLQDQVKQHEAALEKVLCSCLCLPS